jgi:hypothetical protein
LRADDVCVERAARWLYPAEGIGRRAENLTQRGKGD